MRCHARLPENSLNHTASKGFSNICTKGDFHLKLLMKKVPTNYYCFSMDLERMDVGDNVWFFCGFFFFARSNLSFK